MALRNWLSGWGPRPSAYGWLPEAPITAAAETFDGADRSELSRLDQHRQADLPWQWQALMDAERCGTVGYASGFVEIMLGRFAYQAGWLNPEGEPEPLTDGPLAAAVDQLENRQQGRSSLFGRLGGLWFLCGEGWLVGSGDRRSPTWEVLSTAELRLQGPRFMRHGYPGSMEVPLAPGSVPIRCWWPSLAYFLMARSPHKSAMRDVSRLVTLEDSAGAIAHSRLVMRGAFIYPSEVNDSRRPLRTAEGQTVPQPTFGEDFIEISRQGIEDPSSVAGQVPIPLGVPSKDSVANVAKFIDFGSKQDARIIDLLQDARRNYGNSVWLPVDELMGKGDLNHWNYWGVTADTARHLVPIAEAMADSVARAYLRPVARAAGLDERRVVMIADATPVIVAPDRSDAAIKLWDRLIISDAALLRESHFDETDAPDEAEHLRRLAEKIMPQAIRRSDPSTADEVIRDVGIEVPLAAPITAKTAGEAGAAANNATAPAADNVGSPPPPVVAAGPPGRPLRRLSQRLARIEARTRERLQRDMEHSLEEALVRAGNRVLSAGQKRGLRQRLAHVAREEVVALLGRTTVEQLGLSEDELLRDSSAALKARAKAELTAAHRQALQAVADEGDRGDAWIDAEMASTEHDRDAAAILLAAFLTAIAAKRLFEPHPAAPEKGEISGSVPASLVGYALSRAGGQPTPSLDANGLPTPTPTGEPVLGLTSGPSMQGAVGELFPAASFGWTWSWGGSLRAFDPHLDLDGTTFTDWSDPVLSVPPGYEWLGTTFLFPADHEGCSCAADLEIGVGAEEAVAAAASD